jgi:hypothetical protein
VDPQYLTWEDERNFGPEILDVAQRAARQAMAPAMNRLEQENEQLRDHVAREVQRNLHSQVAAAVPNWDAINRDPRWFQWLADYDVYSGYRRQDLLNDATAKGDAQRVIAIFRGFLAAAGQPGQVGQPGPRQFVQPGRGQIYTRDQITQMWNLRRQGKIDDQQWRRWEVELCRASAEGRVRAALDWQTGLPVTL